MSDLTDRPPVPEPRGRGDDGPWFPQVPAPRGAPSIERLPGSRPVAVPRPRSSDVPDDRARSAERPAPAVPSSTALTLRPSQSHTFRDWTADLVRVVTRAIAVAAGGLRAAVEHLACRPATRPATPGSS